MKIVNIKSVGRKPVYDLTVNSDNYDDQHYILENGVVTHNTGIYYSADNIWIVGRRQNKTGTEVTGYDFVINVEKSRYVKEKSKIPISVSWDGGVECYSGLLDVALASGHVIKPSNGWYQKVDISTGEVMGNKVRQADTLTSQFWEGIIDDDAFKTFLKNQYSIGLKSQVEFDDILEGDTDG